MIMELKVPPVGESISEVVVGQWLKKDGDYVEAEDVLCELESEKASFELRAESSGILRIIAQEGSEVPIGDVVAKIEEGKAPNASKASSPPTKEASKQNTAPVDTPTPSSGDMLLAKASPAAAKLMRESNINHQDVKPTGKNNGITKQDILAFKAQKNT